MVVDFIERKTERHEMEDTLARPIAGNAPEVEDWTPTPIYRCDYECPAQAMVRATGLYGELYFCHHHYSLIKRNDQLNNKLKTFAFDIQDKGDILIENRLKE